MPLWRVWDPGLLRKVPVSETVQNRTPGAPGRTLAVTHSEEASDSNDPEWFPEALPHAAKQHWGHSTTPVSCAARGCGDALPRPAIPYVRLFRRVKSWVPGGWPSTPYLRTVAPAYCR